MTSAAQARSRDVHYTGRPEAPASTFTVPRAWPAPPRVAGLARTLGLGGVAVRADLSCAFGIALSAWTFASGFLPETDPGYGTAAYWAAGVTGALLVMASLLLHELGHAIAARRAGLGVAQVTLSFVGGTSEIVGPIRRAGDELTIALAGPLASVVVMLAAAAAHVILVETTGPGLPATVAALVAVANLAIVVLNAIPGLPLDGGRALHAVLWAFGGRPEAATRFATAAGRRCGEALIVIAVLASAFGFVALALWAALLGVVMREG
jgi:Zn-dependent protease